MNVVSMILVNSIESALLTWSVMRLLVGKVFLFKHLNDITESVSMRIFLTLLKVVA